MAALNSFFFFHLRAHNQQVDYSGAYNWGCSLLYWSGETRKKKRKKKKGIVQFDTLDTKASRVGTSTTSVGSEFQSLMVFGRKEEQRASGRLFHSGMMQTVVCCRRDITRNMLAVVSLAAGSTGSCGRACQKNRSWSSGGFSPGSQLFLERYWSLSSVDHS